jgi:hypothetical protein
MPRQARFDKPKPGENAMFQFRLRSLLLATLLVAVVLALLRLPHAWNYVVFCGLSSLTSVYFVLGAIHLRGPLRAAHVGVFVHLAPCQLTYHLLLIDHVFFSGFPRSELIYRKLYVELVAAALLVVTGAMFGLVAWYPIQRLASTTQSVPRSPPEGS